MCDACCQRTASKHCRPAQNRSTPVNNRTSPTPPRTPHPLPGRAGHSRVSPNAGSVWRSAPDTAPSWTRCRHGCALTRQYYRNTSVRPVHSPIHPTTHFHSPGIPRHASLAQKNRAPVQFSRSDTTPHMDRHADALHARSHARLLHSLSQVRHTVALIPERAQQHRGHRATAPGTHSHMPLQQSH